MKLLENNSFERLGDALTTEDSMDGRIDARIESYRFIFCLLHPVPFEYNFPAAKWPKTTKKRWVAWRTDAVAPRHPTTWPHCHRRPHHRHQRHDRGHGRPGILVLLERHLLNTRPARTTKISWWAHVRERRCFIWFRRWINRTALIMTSHPSNRTSSRTSRVVHGWRTLSIRLWPRHWATSLRLKWGTRSVDWPLTLSSRQHV